MKIKFSLALVTLSLLAATAFAQTQNIPVPASSVNGGRAVVAITIPSLPGNICTASNGNCVTEATLKGLVDPLIPTPTVINNYYTTTTVTGGGGEPTYACSPYAKAIGSFVYGPWQCPPVPEGN